MHFKPKLKRLKRGHRDESEPPGKRGLDKIFDDDDEDDEEPHQYGRLDRVNEFADFIEEDELEDDEARQEQMEVARPRERGVAWGEAMGVDQDALEELELIFGNGDDYDWALALEEEAEAQELGEQAPELKDVFEPSQLAEKLLTDADNVIRWADEPERFQLDRKPFKNTPSQDEHFKEEARWISNLLWPNKRLHSDLHGPFTRAIGKILEFFIVDGVEVPFIFQHRKDYLIHAQIDRRRGSDGEKSEVRHQADKLLNQDDLWRISDLDLKFRALIEKREIL